MTRVFDLFVSVAGILILWPLLLLVAIVVRLTSRGPALYRAQRVGKDGRLFTLYKFRSMTVASTGDQPKITRRGDARVTRAGAFLRRTKLDELPQLFNVARGDMSLVGPRPEDPKYVALYSLEERRVLSVRPGITSATSLAYRDEEALLDRPDWEEHYVAVVMKDKLRRELEYLDRRSLLSDIRVLAQTFAFIARPRRDTGNRG